MPAERPLYKAHWLFGLLCWSDAEAQYRRVNQKDGYPSPDKFAEIQAEADRLNALALPRPIYPAFVQLVPGEF